jgi:uncharacterized protein (DUF2147 family)
LSARYAWQLLVLCVLEFSPAPAARAADAQAQQILGRWVTEPRTGVIEISVAGDGDLQGTIIGGDSPNRLDTKNPDSSKRSAPLLGQLIIKQMKYDGSGHWSGGTIYDPDSGRTYRCRFELLEQDRLKVRGFLGFSLLGRTQVWTRFNGSSLVLPPASR